MRNQPFSKRIVMIFGACVGVACGLGCEEVPGLDGSGGGGSAGSASGGGETGGGGADPFAGGTPVEVEVPEEGRVWLDLDTQTVAGDGDGEWDLAFEGVDVFTNGGASGSGKGAAFGPFEAAAFVGDEVPEHPFLIEDESGGAFVDWFAYDGSDHVIYSRFHVYGVRRADALYKVQILGYYGDLQGAPTSGIYSLRVAAVGDEVGATKVIEGLDATAGGPSGGDDAESACVVLETGETLMLTLAEAAASTKWDLCFRRASVAVNGDLGGPGEVTAVDLDRAATEGESLEEVKARSAASELGRFDAVVASTLSDPTLPWRGDRIVSAFSDHWIEPGSAPLSPVAATWLVAGSNGTSPFLIAFDRFTGATAAHPGTVRVVVKPLGGSL